MGATDVIPTQVLVVGSGAGGAITAATLAEHGYDVAMLEEGPNIDTTGISTNSTEAISRLYRNGGMTPVLGNQAIAYVEGRCVGGSTEINSAFWHRLPPDCYVRWRTDALLEDFSPDIMEPYFERIEQALSVSFSRADQVPKSSVLFRESLERLRWQYAEVPRCQKDSPSGNPFAPGAKQSMQRTYIPRALAAGVRLLPDAKALRLRHENGVVRGVRVAVGPNGTRRMIEIQADTVFLCCGAIQTPVLLRRSGIKKNVGDNLCIHPMIKAAALFDVDVDAHEAALPIYQVKEFWPTITIGGSVFTPGFLAMLLADNWQMYRHVMVDWRRTALYYAATRGMNRGVIRVLPGVEDGVVIRYRLSESDQQNLSIGLARLGEILFAAGAKAVYPSLISHPILKSPGQCRGFLKNPIPISSMALSTVHAFSSCPMGENPDLCATDSFGRVNGFHNLFINDASLIPDSPGVNPQGPTMAIALRNVERFIERAERAHGRRARAETVIDGAAPSSGATRRAAAFLVTGVPGWLGTRLVEVLAQGFPDLPAFAEPDPARGVRCLVRREMAHTVPPAIADAAEIAFGDLTDRDSLRKFCRTAEGATLVHIAGVIHPTHGTKEFGVVNVEGTRTLLAVAQDAGVKRVVTVSSNSPIGCNPRSDHLFDEQSPYNPYMGYGRSKQQMEGLVHEAQASGKIETVIIRPPWFYGPHQPLRQTVFFSMIKDGRFPILGDGEQRRSMAYVDNICQGLLLAATLDHASGQTYWIADERPYTVNEIVDTVEQVLEHEFGFDCAKRRLRLPSVAGDIAERLDAWLQAAGVYQQKLHVLGEMNKTIACSIAKAQRDLGYTPRWTLREGMIESIRWCLENGQRI